MANAKHDDNFNPTLIGVSSSDGVTPLNAEIDPSTGRILVDAEVTAEVDTTGLASDANQTNGSQKTQIVDAGGEAVTVTDGKLDVNASASLAGESLPVSGATEGVAVAIVDGSGNQITSFGGGTQYTEGDTDSSITGTAIMWEDASETLRPVSAAKPLPVDLQDTSVAITDGGGSITIDGTVTANLSATDNAVLDAIQVATEATQAAVEGTLTVDGSGATQPISHAALTELAAAIDTEVQVDIVGALPAGDNNIGNVDIASSVLPTGAATSANQTTIIGHLDGVETLLTSIESNQLADGHNVTIDNASGASAVNIQDGGNSITVDNGGTFATQATQSGTWTVQPGNTANSTPWLVSQRPATSGGLSIFRSLDIDETEEEIKASAGQVFGWYMYNAASSVRYVKFYNATAANVTVGSTTPVLTIPLPATSGANVEFTNGIAFGTAITVAATTGVADADTGAPSANDVIVNVLYK